MKKNVFNNLVIAAFYISAVLVVPSCETVKDILYERYTVTFDLNYENNPAATQVKVEEGKTVSEPTKPTRNGWEFTGWYKDVAGRTPWNFNTDVITSDITLYAKWTEIKFTVTFNSNSGSSVATQTLSYGDKVTRPADPTRAGYRFDGWYTENTFASAWNFTGESVTANVILYAKWTQLFTVTFDTDGGSDAPEPQTIGAGEKSSKPSDPSKFKAGLYTGNVTAEDVRCSFEGWYNGATEWNFETDIVTAHITLTAKWSGGGTPIAAVAANDLPTSIAYINANAGTYSLLINRDISISTQQTLNMAQRHLTILGLGGGRKITYTNYDNLFRINNNDARLTLDENVILSGNNSRLSDELVYVQAGNLTMKAGSKITGHNNIAVYVTGANSRFIMEGGEISDNSSGGGVYVISNATFTISGGRITGNSYSSSVANDVFINDNAGTFTLLGNAEIAALTLNKANNGANSSVTIGTEGFTGIVSVLNLRVDTYSNITNVIDQWTLGVIVPTVLKEVTNANVLSRFTLGKFINYYLSTSQDISPKYKLELVGGGEAKLVWQ